MTPGTYNITALVENDTFNAILLRLTDGNNNPIDITGQTITWTVSPTKDSSTFVIQKSTTSGITITDGADGQLRIDQINNFNVPEGEYIHQVKFVYTSGKTKTYLQGTLNVLFKLRG